MARSLLTGCFDGGSSTSSALSARRLARESRSRPWLANSILARKGAVDSGAGSGPHVGDAPTVHEEKSPVPPASPAGNEALVTSSSEESLMAKKASGVALWAKAKSLVCMPSRIPRLRVRSAREEATKPSDAAALSEGHVTLSLGSGNLARSRAGATRAMSSSGWVRRVTAAVSSLERKLRAKTAGNSQALPGASSQVPVRSRSASAVLSARPSRRRDPAHTTSPSLLFGKVSSAMRIGVFSGRKKPKKSILKVKDPSKPGLERRVRSLLDRAQVKQRPRVHFDGYPISFVGMVDGPDDYDRTSTVCWSCNLNAVVEGGHGEDCSSFDDDPFEEAPSRAEWGRSQKRLREAQEEALAIASGGSIRC